MTPSRATLVRCACAWSCVAMTTCIDPEGDSTYADADLVDPVEGTCDAEATGPRDPFADCVESFEPADGVSFGHEQMPTIVLGAPQGAGELMGGTHVASLGCGGSITLHFSEPWPVDGPGPDLVVFENAFISGSSTFIEPAQVLVSEDGTDWYAFECDAQSADAHGCAGREPVLEGITNPADAGGDLFDLADVGLAEARYVRLVDRTDLHYGNETWCLGAAGGFDLDAVGVREAAR